jgi:putative ABC transport system permease protein
MRLYRALLRLYPFGYRQEYGEELLATFAARARERGGPLAPARNGLAAFGDVVPNAILVHADLLRQDLRHAVRSLARTPGFALTVVLVVALGVGANTAAFSLADFVLFRPLPFHEPDRLVKLWQATPGYGRFELSPANYRDWRTAARSFQGVAAYANRQANLVGAAEPERLEIARATPELFGLFGVAPLVGRAISSADSADGQVAVLGYALWQRRFGGDPRVLGSTVRLDGEPYAVIGVMPPGFRFPSRETDAWTPLIFGPDDYEDRNDNYVYAVARLGEGVSLRQAGAEMATIAANLERQFPEENKDTRALVVGLRDDLSEGSRLLVLALCGAALCILLLACANLASLLLVRATGRARELAVRAALGAGPERLVRQLVTESLTLAAIGGGLGVAIALVGTPLLGRLVPAALPVTDEPSANLPMLLAAVVLTVLTGLSFGVGPAVAAARRRSFAALRDGARAGGGRTRRVRAGLIVTEVAASAALLVSSGLLLRAVDRLHSVDPGFRADNVLTLSTALPWATYMMTERRERFYHRVLTEVRALPGVESAAYVTGLPMRLRGGVFPVAIAGEVRVADATNSAGLRAVTPQYFAALDIPLREGRDVGKQDTRKAPLVAVVSRSFAQRYWPERSAIGMRFTVAGEERTIVGVVGDVRTRGLERQSEPQLYIPSAQMADSSIMFYAPKDLVVRAASAEAALLPAVRRIIAGADPDQPISDVRMLREIVADETGPRVTQVRLLGALSGIALLIAGLGIHGLLAFAVSRRTRELGVRRALGEATGSLVGRVLREGLLLSLAGVGIGIAAAYLAARTMGALLAGVAPADPVTLAIAAALCLATAVAGGLRPAIRAARVDPVIALREE